MADENVVMQKAPKDVGIDMIHVAKLLSDVLGSGAPSYVKPVWIPEAVSNKVAPQSYSEKFRSDNGVSEVMSGTTSAQLSTTVGGASRNAHRALMGKNPLLEDQKYEEGNFLDDPEPVAYGYRRMIFGKLPDGRQKYRYVWILKTVLVPPEENSDTMADKPNVTPAQYSGESMALDSFKPSEMRWRVVMDNWEAGVTQEDEDNFFKQVIFSKAGPPAPEPEQP